MKYILPFVLVLLSFTSNAQIDDEFWFGAPDLTMGSGVEARRDSTVYIVVSSFNQPTEVTILQPANLSFEPIVINLAPNSVEEINLGTFLSLIETKPANAILNTGLLIRSDEPITAYYEVRSPANRDLWSLKGSNSLGTEFIVPFQTEYQNNQTLNGNAYIPGPRSGFIVMATRNNTTVSITPSIDILGHSGGETFEVFLNRGQTYYCEALDGAPENHPSGSIVTSDKPITVTIKDDMVDVDPSNDGGADVLGDQLVANEYLGTEHIIIDGSLNNESDRVVVVAILDNTEVFINGNTSPDAVLNIGEQYIFQPAEPANFIESSEAVSVLQLTGAADQVAGAIIPGLGCRGSNQVGFVRGSSGPFFLNVTIRAGAEDEFELNGDPDLVPASAFEFVPGSNEAYVWAQFQFSNGQLPANQAHVLTNFSDELFHLGVTNRSTSASANFGYFSAFSFLNLGKNAEVCLGDSTVLDAGPGKTSYLWSTDETTQSITVDEPGIYTVEVFSGSDCSATDTITVEYYEPPVDLGPNDTICDGTSVTLDFEFDGTFLFVWSDGSEEDSLVVDEAGLYWVQISDFQQCITRDSIEVFTSPRPQTPEILGDLEYCRGENIELSMGDFGDVSYRYILPSGAIVTGQNLLIENAQVSNSGLYQAFYIEEGCETFADSVTVIVLDAPQVDLGEDISVCEDVPVILDPNIEGDGELTWQDGSEEPTYIVMESGQYWLDVTNNLGCTGTDTINVELRPLPINPVIAGENVYCGGDTLILSTDNQEDAQFIWSDPNGDILSENSNILTINSVTPDNSGEYNVQVEINGCQSEIASFVVLVNPQPELELTTESTDICIGDAAVIFATEGYETYNWSTGASGTSISVGGGIYNLDIIDAQGCTNTASITINESGPIAAFNIFPDTIFNPGITLNLVDQSSSDAPLTSWFWDFGNGDFSQLQNPDYAYEESGVFTIVLLITDADGCTSSASQFVLSEFNFRIPEGFSPNGDGFNDVFEIQGLETLDGTDVQIFNRWGAKVFESTDYKPGNFWDGDNLPDGTYFYVVKLPNGETLNGPITIAR